MDHHNNHNDGICECKASGAVQSLDDMDFERGIWAAGKIFSIVKKLVVIQ